MRPLWKEIGEKKVGFKGECILFKGVLGCVPETGEDRIPMQGLRKGILG
jgi:hypothetical protein